MNRLTKYIIQKSAESVARTFAEVHAKIDPIIAKRRNSYGTFAADRVEIDYPEGERQAKAQRGRPVGEAGRRKTDSSLRASHAAEAYSVGSGDNGNGMEDNCPIWTMGIALANRDAAVA